MAGRETIDEYEEKKEGEELYAGREAETVGWYGEDGRVSSPGYEGMEFAPPSPAGEEVTCKELCWEEEEEMKKVERMAISIKVLWFWGWGSSCSCCLRCFGRASLAVYQWVWSDWRGGNIFHLL